MAEEMVKYKAGEVTVELNPETVRKYLVSGGGTITNQEIMMFLRLCEYQKLNPFLREVYLIKYGDKNPATMVTGKATFLKRAYRHPKYRGHKTGISADGQIAWAEVYVDGYSVPIKCEVDYKEYVGRKNDGTVNSMWASKPNTMLKKCFDDQTSILTNTGFKLFEDLDESDLVAQVTDARTIQFVKPIAIIINQETEQTLLMGGTSKLDMAVTLDHRVTVLENNILVEKKAEDVFAEMRYRKCPIIPRTALFDSPKNNDWTYPELDLLGFYLADGHDHTKKEIGIKVAKSYKIDALISLGLHSSYKEQPYINPVFCIDRWICNPLPQVRFLYSRETTKKIKTIIGEDKALSMDRLNFSSEQIRRILDAWILFDGCKYHTQAQLFTSRENHRDMAMLMGVLAGYSVKLQRVRNSGFKDNYVIAFSDIAEVKPGKPNYILSEYEGQTFCVSVPSGRIIVKRNGYSHISGNCALVQTLREAFPETFSGMYSQEEINSINIPLSTEIVDTQAEVTIDLLEQWEIKLEEAGTAANSADEMTKWWKTNSLAIKKELPRADAAKIYEKLKIYFKKLSVPEREPGSDDA